MLLDRPSGPIGVLVSGGADSALLLYYLMDQHDDTIFIYTMNGLDKFGKNSSRVPAIAKWCAERTGFRDYIQIVKPVQTQTSELLFQELRQWIREGHIQGLYSGVTANPPRDVVASFRTEHGQSEDRDPLTARPTYMPEEQAYFPFWNLDKRQLAELYQESDLMPLFDLTSSCEWQPPGPYRTGIDPEREQCGYCWWCEERQWGFGRL